MSVGGTGQPAESKTCAACGQSKPQDEFYRPGRACKRCHLERANKWRAANRERVNATNRARHQANMAAEVERIRRYRKAHPERVRAWMVVKNELGRGRMERPDACTRCGTSGPVQAHHADYSKPLGVEWVCALCHAAIHNEVAA